jgi:outer membrane protein OmpA-like peptidoglycan-associated protein
MMHCPKDKKGLNRYIRIIRYQGYLLMRNMAITAAAVAGTLFSVSASAQATTPDQIICAMSGSCAGGVANSAQKIEVRDEKSFSLVKTSSAATPHTAAASGVGQVASRTRIASVESSAVKGAPRIRPASGRVEMMVSFGLGSAELTEQAKGEAHSFAAAMTSPALADMRFNIEGHTDAVGARDRNLDLSQRRAQSVVDYLVSLGIPASRLVARGYGPDKPRPGLSPMSPANRRVEFVKAG